MMEGTPPGEDNVFSRFTEPEQATWKRQALILGLLLLVGFLGLWLWIHSDEQRTIAAMAPAQRAELFKARYADFRDLCIAGKDPAAEVQCHHHAESLLRFPECDDACKGEVAPVLRRTSR
jgi:hypothetical protein